MEGARALPSRSRDIWEQKMGYFLPENILG